MTEFGLPKRTLDEMRSIFAAHSKVKKVIIYGSRAMGNYRPGSDIDLTVCGEHLTHRDLTQIAGALDDSSIPYSTDLSLFDHLDHAKLKDHIQRKGQVFYYRYAEWKTVKLEKLCKIISGNSIPAKKKEEHFTDVEGMPYVATKDIGFDGSINYENGVYIPDEYRSNFKISPVGATLVCAEGGSAGRKIAFSTEDCCFVNKLFSLQPDKNIIPKFIYYYTLSIEFQSQFKEAMHGLIGGVSLSKIKDFSISIPPLAEQHRIVAKLDAAFAQIDAAIELAESKEYEIANLRGSLLSNSLSDNAVMWETVKLGDVCTLRNGRAYKKPELLSEGKYPVLRVGNFFTSDKWYYSDLELDDTKYCYNGDLLYAWSASFGARMWEGEKVIYHYHIWRADVDADLIDKKFLYYWFEFDKEQIKKESGTGTTMIHVSKGSMEKRELWLPPLAEQHRIVAKLDAAFADVETAHKAIRKNQANYQALKSAILAQELQSEAA